MRILVFNPSYPPVLCGVGDYSRGLAAALADNGHDVAVVTAAGSTSPVEGAPRVLPVLDDWSITGFARARGRFASPRPDVVVSNFPAVVSTAHSRLIYLLPGLAKVTLGRPRTVFIVHEFLRAGEPERRLLALALLTADRIVAVTAAERDAIVACHPRIADRTVVRENPPTIGVADEDPAADARLRESLGQPGRPLIAYFGFLWPAAKGFEELLQAVANSKASLAVAGSLDPGHPYHAQVRAEIDRLGIGERVRFLGFLDDDQVGRLLRAPDAVVLPFRDGAESGSTSLLGALVNGAAVVTTQGPRTPSWLRDGETALLVDGNDPAALTTSINRSLSDHQMAARLRAQASQLVFGWREIVDAVTSPQIN